MKEKTKLKVIQILCIISLIITVFSIQRTYARYFEKVDTTYASKIKRWVIKVKDTKIHQLEKDELSEVMQPVFIENEHMNNNNTLVPGREGYFPFEIDYGTVDLSFRFNFDLQQLNEITETDQATGNTSTRKDYLEDFDIYGYEILDGENSTIIETKDLTKMNPIIKIDPVNGDKIIYTKINAETSEEVVVTDALDDDKKVEIRILFRWNDTNKDTEETDDKTGMNNNEDTQYVKNHDKLNYKVRVTFTQQL